MLAWMTYWMDPLSALQKRKLKNCWYQLISQGAGKSALHRVSAHPHQPARGKAIAASP